jgi:hypothetical protein
MSRRFTALKPQLNRIRAWAHEGSTDAWIAHQLETTAEAVRAFRQEHGIERGGPAPLAPITPDSVVEAMLAEEEAAAAAAELGFEPIVSEPEPEAEAKPARAPRSRSRQRAAKPAADAPEEAPADEAPAEDGAVAEEPQVAEAPARSSRGRGSRGGASRRTATAAAAQAPEEEATEEAAPLGEEDEPARSASSRKRGRRRGRGRGAGRGLEARLLPGSVLLLDPSVTADPAFQEHWQDAGPLRVEITAEAIVLRRIAADPEPEQAGG